MGTQKNRDASYSVGMGFSDQNLDAKLAGQKQLVIKVDHDTQSVIDDASVAILEYLQDYAENNPNGTIAPPDTEIVIVDATTGAQKNVESGYFQFISGAINIAGIVYDSDNDKWDASGVSYEGGGGGGSDIFRINFTVTVSDDTYSATADKTYAELQSAISDGKTVLATMIDVSGYMLYAVGTAEAPSALAFYFRCTELFDDAILAYLISFGSDNIEVSFNSYSLQPSE